MAQNKFFHFESDNTITVKNLRLVSTGALATTALFPLLTVVANLFAADGTTLIGSSGNPNTLTEVAGVKGKFTGNIPETAVVSVGDNLVLRVVADDGAGLERAFRQNLQVVEKD